MKVVKLNLLLLHEQHDMTASTTEKFFLLKIAATRFDNNYELCSVRENVYNSLEKRKNRVYVDFEKR